MRSSSISSGVARPNGAQVLATPSTPITAGDAIVIYGTGLGDVAPRLLAGEETPGRIAEEVLSHQAIDQLRDPAGFRDRSGSRIHGASRTFVAIRRSKSS